MTPSVSAGLPVHMNGNGMPAHQGIDPQLHHQQQNHASTSNLTANLTPEEVSLFTCLSAYADAIDALPLDLTRSFSDLRELDAVLGPHMASIVKNISKLTEVVRDVDGSQADSGITAGQRLLMLKDCAEEARSYKMGGEDKIRVALNTCETIMTHTDYIDAILDNLLALPELKQLIEPNQRPHVAGELSDGTPITLASAHSATQLAGGSGMFANPSSSGSVIGAPSVGGTGGGGGGTYNGMDVDKPVQSGAGGKGAKKRAAAAAAAAASAAAAALENGLGTTGKAAGSSNLKGKETSSSTSATTASGKKRKGGAGASNIDDETGSKSSSSKKGSTAGGPRKKATNNSSTSAAGSSQRSNAADNGLASPGGGFKGESSSRGGAGSRGATTTGDDYGYGGRGLSNGSGSTTSSARGGAASTGARGDLSRAGSENIHDETRSPGATGHATGGNNSTSGTRSRSSRAPRGSAAGPSGLRRQGDGGQEDDEEGEEGEIDQQPTGRRRGHADDQGSPSMLGLEGIHGQHGGDLSTGRSTGRRTSPSSRHDHRQTDQGSGSHQSGTDHSHRSEANSSTLTSLSTTNTVAAPSSLNGDEPDDTRYCYCNNVSYGAMIGCDNDNCSREWFHLDCVGLTRTPPGTWYCDDCLSERQAKAQRSKAKKMKTVRTTGTHGGGGTEIPANEAGNTGNGGGRGGKSQTISRRG
ncbi:unnamed protein product [Sympodiomycopsis kandeliae]